MDLTMKVLHTILGAALLGLAASPALAVDTVSTDGAPDLTVVRTKIKAADYRGAITELNAMLDQGVQHADAYSLLGYSLRKSGDTKTAMTFYKKALDFNPTHKGALEYQGELYVQIGDVAKARDNAVKLKALCPQGCEELADLQQAINRAAKTQ
jgi:Flp pilus assembly protein TadD